MSMRRTAAVAYIRRNPERIAWTCYDFANSAYVLLIIAFAFPLFFRSILAGGATRSDLWWGMCLGGSVLLAGVIAPLMGTLADSRGLHRPFFRLFVLGAVGGTFLLGFLGPGDLMIGGGVFVFTNMCFNLSQTLYDSYLRSVSGDRLERLSGTAWGIGYGGGIVCLLILFPWVRQLDTADASIYRMIFWFTGLWYFLFAIPFLLTIPCLEKGKGSFSNPARLLTDTLVNWRRYRPLFLFVLAYYFISDAAGTLTNFSSIVASGTLGFSATQIAVLLLYVQVVAIPATIFSGVLAERRGAKLVVMLGVAGWMVVSVWMYWARTGPALIAIATIIGLVIGSTYSQARAMLGQLAPADRTAQAFGFNSFSGRISETLAPLLFGWISSTTGNQRLGVLSMFPVLFVGALLLALVRLPQATSIPGSAGERG